MSDNTHPSPTNPAKQSSPPAPSFLFGAPAPFSAAASSSGSREGSPSKANPTTLRAATPAATSASAAQTSSKTRTSLSMGKARTSDSFNHEPWHVEAEFVPDSWVLERADLKSKLAGAKEEIQEKDCQISDLRTRVGDQQKDVAALNKKVADLKNDIKICVNGIAGAVRVIGSSVKALADLDVPPAEEAASVLRDVVLIQHLNLTNLHRGLGGDKRERPSLKEEWRAEAGAEMEE